MHDIEHPQVSNVVELLNLGLNHPQTSRAQAPGVSTLPLAQHVDVLGTRFDRRHLTPTIQVEDRVVTDSRAKFQDALVEQVEMQRREVFKPPGVAPDVQVGEKWARASAMTVTPPAPGQRMPRIKPRPDHGHPEEIRHHQMRHLQRQRRQQQQIDDSEQRLRHDGRNHQAAGQPCGVASVYEDQQSDGRERGHHRVPDAQANQEVRRGVEVRRKAFGQRRVRKQRVAERDDRAGGSHQQQREQRGAQAARGPSEHPPHRLGGRPAACPPDCGEHRADKQKGVDQMAADVGRSSRRRIVADQFEQDDAGADGCLDQHERRT